MKKNLTVVLAGITVAWLAAMHLLKFAALLGTGLLLYIIWKE